MNNFDLAFNITSNNISVVIDGVPHIINNSDKRYLPLRQAIKDKDTNKVREVIATVSNNIPGFTSDKVRIVGNSVFYGDEQLHGLITDQLVKFMNEGMPFDHLVKFIERLMKNPSFRARNELYGFLEKTGLTIAPDGCFLAYKAVREDWKDYHSGKVENKVGTVIEMPRSSVDDDCTRGCSVGYHVGSLHYVRNFIRSGGKMLVCKVDPADVVSVPKEDAGKLRTCKYVVDNVFTKELPIGAVDDKYNSLASYGHEEDGDYEDDDEYFDDAGWDSEPDYNDDYDDDYDDGCDDCCDDDDEDSFWNTCGSDDFKDN